MFVFLFLSSRENMPSHFKFKEYCPLVFRNLRERFGIDDQEFSVMTAVHILPQTRVISVISFTSLQYLLFVYFIISRNFLFQQHFFYCFHISHIQLLNLLLASSYGLLILHLKHKTILY